MANFTVDILTPSKVVVRDIPAESLLIPTMRGQINVLADHTHVVNKLGTGVMTIFGGANDPDRSFIITTGVCKVLENKITILSNVIEESSELDVDRAKEALKRANEMLKCSDGLSDDEITKYQRKSERAKIRIQLAEKQNKR